MRKIISVITALVISVTLFGCANASAPENIVTKNNVKIDYSSNGWDDAAEDEIKSCINDFEEEYKQFLTTIDTYDKYVKNKDKVEAFYDRVREYNKQLCVRMYEHSIGYAEYVLSSGKSKDDIYDALEDIYDVIYDDVCEDIYDGIYDGILDDMYDDIYDEILDDAYDDVPYKEWHDVHSDEYELWLDTRRDVYEDWLDCRKDIYKFYLDVRKEVWKDDYDRAQKKINNFKDDMDKFKGTTSSSNVASVNNVINEVSKTNEISVTETKNNENFDIRNLRWGMSLDEVKANKKATLANESYYIDLGRTILTYNDVEFRGDKAEMRLYIDNSQGFNCVDYNVPGNHYNEFYTELFEKYGEPSEKYYNYYAKWSNLPTNYDIFIGHTETSTGYSYIMPEMNMVTSESLETEGVSSDGIRSEFKAAMDSYEAFFDEYIEFMRNYSESDDALSMMSEYFDYLEKYSETMEALDDIDDDDLSDEELKYYTEVMLRIEGKLLNAYT